MNPAEIAAKTQAPRTDRELVFKTPWEARIFALVAHMAEDRHFEWDAFRERLIETIAAGDPQDGTCDDTMGTPYYRSWLSAAEALLDAIGVCSHEELAARMSRLSAPQAPGRQSPTGNRAEPVSLG